MSRLGKRAIQIPDGVEAKVDKGTFTAKGKLGELSREFKDLIKIEITDAGVVLTPANEELFTKALWGTYASHVDNMIKGVSEGFTKKMIIEGTGYRAEVKGDTLVMNLGYSHPVELKVPEGLKVEVEKNMVSVSGVDKEVVGSFASLVRSKRKPEPYKGKGIRYDGEVIERKQGKRSVA